jgi:Family of unknown function (DUF6962)
VSEVGAGVTDLVLGAVLVGCASRLRRSPGVHRYWVLMWWSAGAGAFAGAAHHLLFSGSSRAADLSWVVVGVLVAVALSYLLAATATANLEPRLAGAVIRVRVAGLLVYGAWMGIAGIGRTAPLVLSESVTMTAIVGLWCYGLYAGRRAAGRVLVALAVLALSAVFFVLPARVFPSSVGLDARSLQHLAQIPGVLLLSRVVVDAAEPSPGMPRRPTPLPRR